MTYPRFLALALVLASVTASLPAAAAPGGPGPRKGPTRAEIAAARVAEADRRDIENLKKAALNDGKLNGKLLMNPQFSDTVQSKAVAELLAEPEAKNDRAAAWIGKELGYQFTEEHFLAALTHCHPRSLRHFIRYYPGEFGELQKKDHYALVGDALTDAQRYSGESYTSACRETFNALLPHHWIDSAEVSTEEAR